MVTRPHPPLRCEDRPDLTSFMEGKVMDLLYAHYGTPASPAKVQEVVDQILAENPGVEYGLSACWTHDEDGYNQVKYMPRFMRELTDEEYSAAMTQYQEDLAEYRLVLEERVARGESLLAETREKLRTVNTDSRDFVTIATALSVTSTELLRLRVELRDL